MQKGSAVKDLVNRIRTGDQGAFSQLYRLTRASAMAVAARYLKNPEDREDVLQEAYILSLEKISDLKKPESYTSWLCQIVATRSLNLLRKKQPLVFSELTAEETDGDIDFEDETPSFQPEKIADMKAVSAAVKDVMNLLPEMQRDALWMHYGQGIPIKDIAAAAGVSENTVKSRLKQGRDKLSGMQREFRKRGIEVAGISLAVLLFSLFTWETEVEAAGIRKRPDYEKSCCEGETRLRKKIKMPEIKEGISGTKTVGAAATTAAKTGIGLRIAISVAAAVLVAGSILEIRSRNNRKTAGQEESAEMSATAGTATAEDAASALDSTAAPEAVASETVTDAASADEKKTWGMEQYRELLQQTDTLEPFATNTDKDQLSGYYMYTLCDVEGEPLPALLLGQQDINGNIWVAAYFPIKRENTESYFLAERSFCRFGPEAEGVLMWKPENGNLYFVRKNPNYSDGRIETSDISLRTDPAELTAVQENDVTFEPGESVEKGREIQWIDVTEPMALENWPVVTQANGPHGYPADYPGEILTFEDLTGSDEAENPQNTLEGKGQGTESGESSERMTDGDRTVLTGEIRTVSYDEVLALQDMPDLNPGPDTGNGVKTGTYTLFILDTPRELSFASADPAEEGELITGNVQMILIAGYSEDKAPFTAYEGKHVTASFDPEQTAWPTDASVPMGQPRTRDIRILQVQ